MAWLAAASIIFGVEKPTLGSMPCMSINTRSKLSERMDSMATGPTSASNASGAFGEHYRLLTAVLLMEVLGHLDGVVTTVRSKLAQPPGWRPRRPARAQSDGVARGGPDGRSSPHRSLARSRLLRS